MLLRPHQWVCGRWPWGYGSVLSIIIQGPNFIWHADGYDKLKPFGITIHAAIDGYNNNTQSAAVAPRPSTTHPLLWVEQHKIHQYTTYLCLAYLHDTSLYYSAQQNFTKIPSEGGVVEHTHNYNLDFLSSHIFRASRDSCEQGL